MTMPQVVFLNTEYADLGWLTMSFTAPRPAVFQSAALPPAGRYWRNALELGRDVCFFNSFAANVSEFFSSSFAVAINTHLPGNGLPTIVIMR